MLWPIPIVNNEYVSIFFSADFIACSWIQKNKSGSASFVLCAYQRYRLDNYEAIDLFLYNPTKIKYYISSFLLQHSLQNAFVTFCLDGITERYIAFSTSTPHYDDFHMSHSSNMQWEYRYLYPTHDGHYVFYTYAVARSLILQYKLLALGLQCNLIRVTTKSMALLEAYKNIFGAAFRKSQLAVDMIRYDNIIDNLISDDSLHRMIRIDNGIVMKDEKIVIATACGLFSSEER